MRNIYTAITLGLIVSYASVSGTICKKDQPCSKEQLKENVNEAFTKCRTIIATVDNVKKEVFEPSIGFIHFRTKNTLKDLQKKLDYNSYLLMLNDAKYLNGKNKTEAIEKIDAWTNTSKDGLHELGLKVSEALRASASYCVQPIDFIRSHIEALTELARGKT